MIRAAASSTVAARTPNRRATIEVRQAPMLTAATSTTPPKSSPSRDTFVPTGEGTSQAATTARMYSAPPAWTVRQVRGVRMTTATPIATGRIVEYHAIG